MKPISPHWADQMAVRIVKTWGDRDEYTVASGVTPSGTVHIGNFREVFTVDLVARALRSISKKVRFIHSWDDFDTFRKVPKNLPKQEMLKENLFRCISRIPDPHDKSESYADFNKERFEGELRQVGIVPNFLSQHEKYKNGEYAELIRQALENTDKIKEILNESRTTPLAEEWLPTSIYCERCDRDEMAYQKYQGEWDYSYKCSSCGHEATTDIRKTHNLKLNWRVDWPMRWGFEKVDFEPGGKDHSSEGGSFDTAKKIVEGLWNRKPPTYLQYDFVSIKGAGGKMSSSSGSLFTLSDAYQVYEPQMVRWIFASQRPNHDFSLAFDADVIKTYDEFDRAEAAALGPKPEKLGKWPIIRRVYELSCVDEVPSKVPYRAPFRELCNRLQIFDGDGERTLNKYYANDVKDEQDRQAFLSRCQKAWNWLQSHAPEEFRYAINKEKIDQSFEAPVEAAVTNLIALIKEIDLESITPKELNQLLYDKAIHPAECEPKSFFKAVYQKLILRDQGPRLPSFLKEVGEERLLHLL